MKRVNIPFISKNVEIELPDETEVLSMQTPQPLSNEAQAIQQALDNPIQSLPLEQIVEAKKTKNPHPTAVIVISDNTRPVPYTSDNGILWPIIERLLHAGVNRRDICVLVATGTHRAMHEQELREMIDERVFLHGIPVINHNCRDAANLSHLGSTKRGTKVLVNKSYLDADIKILTGLVESHFMAGVSGGRKSVCPGLLGEEGTYVFHGAEMLASKNVRDLNITDNPVHEEALEVAIMAGVDFIVNVTLDHAFKLTGVFAGHLVYAHEAAARCLRDYVAIPLDKQYDIVITHGGYVGLNHYQVGKVAVVAIQAVKQGGHLLVVGDNTDVDPVGSLNYKTVLYLLKLFGVEGFLRLIQSPDWMFIPEQWQVQMWAKLFAQIPQEHFLYYSPQFEQQHYRIIPGFNGNDLLSSANQYTQSYDSMSKVIQYGVLRALKQLEEAGISKPSMAYLADGPYGIIVLDN